MLKRAIRERNRRLNRPLKNQRADGRLERPKNTDYIVLAPASFLTFGKVNPGPPQTDIFLGEGPSPPPPHFCQRRHP